jgi:hypothetical protein
MITQKDKMLRMVLNDPWLIEHYHYDLADYSDIFDALDSDCPVVVAVAKIIKELDGSTDPSDQKKVYNTIFNYLNNNLLS